MTGQNHFVTRVDALAMGGIVRDAGLTPQQFYEFL